MRSFFILVSLTFLASCGNKKTSVDYGKTTKADLIVLKGEPLEERPTIESKGQTLIYADEEKYQLTDDVVKFKLRNPEEDEKTILYWKHQFKTCATKKKQINKMKKGHAPKQFQLTCQSQGLAVIYQEGSDFIERVIEYEKQ